MATEKQQEIMNIDEYYNSYYIDSDNDAQAETSEQYDITYDNDADDTRKQYNQYDTEDDYYNNISYYIDFGADTDTNNNQAFEQYKQTVKEQYNPTYITQN